MKRLFAIIIALLCLSAVLVGAPVGAANANVGYVDFSFGSAPGTDPTADKPQSKLWYNDGRWWAVMYHSGSSTWHIYKLNWPSQWVDTGTVIDSRPTSRADVLWDDAAKKLYIASLVRFSSTNQGQFSRYSYSSASQTYSLDSGFPAVMMTGSAETLAMDRDSTGQFWITYTQGSKVYVNRSTGSDNTWGTPFVVPGPTSATSLNSDDISSLVAYTDNDGSSIGVLWSNHNSPSSMYFSHHRDSDADTSWQSVEQIYTANCAADDHINLKSLQSDASGAIYAAVKTSFGDGGCGGSSSSPLLRLVVRKPNNTWAWATFATVGDDETRPQVLLDTTNRKVYMFATSPTSCGVIYMKSTSMDNLSFPTGKGTPFVSSSTYTCLNNVTSTKQTVNAATGLVVMASDESKLFYMHNTLDLGAPPSDTTAPTVTSKSPAANATSVATGTSVTATFSEAVTGVSGSTFTLTPAGGADVAATVSYNSSTNTATLVPSVALNPNTTYTASLAPAITDAAGNPLAATSWSFITASAPPPDTTPPTVTNQSPAANATGVATSASVTAAFSEAVAGVSGSTFTLTGPAGAVAATVSYNSSTKVATLAPSAALAANTTYTANLTSGIADTSGNSLAATGWSFTTGNAVSNTQIKAITFENGSLTDATTGADAVVGTVMLESSTPLDGSYAATINSSSGYLREDFTGVNELYASFYLRLNAAPTASSRMLLISNGSTSAGNIYLTTSRTLQLRNGSTTIGTSAALTVGTLYKVGLHQKAGSGNAVVEAYVTPVGSAFGSPFASSSTQSFTTQATRLSLGATNSSATNITVDDITLDTAGFGGGSTPADTTPPTVTAAAPANNASDVSLSSAVTATFSEAVTGVSTSSFYMTGPNGTVAANVSYNSANKTATLQPSALLSPGAAYSVFLTGTIKDTTNNALAPVQWSFTTTVPPADTTPPTITSVSPVANATNVGAGTSIKVTFSEPVVNVSTSTFTLSPGGPSIAATVSYDNATNTATLVPSAALQPNTQYTATVWSDITDTAGNPLNSYSWLFTTASAPVDSTPPTVTSKSPAANASNVSRNLNVLVGFSEAVTGVSASTFTLSGPNGPVAAGVAYLPGNTATLTPSVTLDANTTYTVNLSSGIADTAGNPLAATSWSFTTAGATSATQIKAMTFENGSLTNATTGADSVVGTVALETANPLKGAFSATINNSSGYLREDFTAVDEVYTSFYLRVNALGSNARLALITNGSASAGNIYLTSTGALQLRNGSTVIGVNSAALTPGTLYRVGLHQKKGTGGNAVLEAYVAVGDAAFGSPFASSAAQSFTTQATRFSLGATNSAAMNVTVDTVVLDTAGF